MLSSTRKTELDHLEDFILNNPELEKLETLLSEFNVFETLSLTYAEIRHSNVLAWLLNPNENHSLSSFFIRQFLKYIVSSNRSYFESSKLTVFDFELFSYTNIEIRREWNNIDILLILIEGNKKVVIAIENKIKTTEHGDQLSRYRKIVEEEFREFIPLYIYLTPENLIPSNEAWIPFSYEIIADLLNNLLVQKKSVVSQQIHGFILQYTTILRRYIVGNSEVEKISLEIYKKHKKALDIIYQYKPDYYSDMSNFIQQKLQKYDFIIMDTCGKTRVKFTTDVIESYVDKISEGWTKSKRMVLFEITLYENRLPLGLYIGPGDNAYRNKLYEFFLKNKSFFKNADRTLGAKWHCVYQKEFIKVKNVDEVDLEEMKIKVGKRIDEFVKTELQTIHVHFKSYWKNS